LYIAIATPPPLNTRQLIRRQDLEILISSGRMVLRVGENVVGNALRAVLRGERELQISCTIDLEVSRPVL
jgi:hypothetical protein